MLCRQERAEVDPRVLLDVTTVKASNENVMKTKTCSGQVGINQNHVVLFLPKRRLDFVGAIFCDLDDRENLWWEVLEIGFRELRSFIGPT